VHTESRPLTWSDLMVTRVCKITISSVGSADVCECLACDILEVISLGNADVGYTFRLSSRVCEEGLFILMHTKARHTYYVAPEAKLFTIRLLASQLHKI
jgi:hypothetical protein